MGATNNETVREVCADISYLTGDLADRILAAHEREMDAKDAEIAKHERCYYALVVHCKELENEYLKAMAALKPVMELYFSNENTCTYDELQDDMGCALNAVREAQRVMREGGVE